MVDWLLINELGGVKVVMKVLSLPLFCHGDLGVGKTYLRYGLRLPSENVARLNSSNNSSLVIDKLCD